MHFFLDTVSVFLLQYEILFCFQDAEDSAIKLVQRLVEAYPLVNSKIFTCEYFVQIMLSFLHTSGFFDFAEIEYRNFAQLLQKLHATLLRWALKTVIC